MRSRFFLWFAAMALLSPFALAGAAFAASDDSYLLALTWQPGFCASGDHAKGAECKASNAPRFTLHGLWPDWDVNGDGRQNADDAYCLPGESGRKSILELEALAGKDGDWRKLPEVTLSAASRSDLAGVMPGVQVGLERHEWWKHGTCSGLQPDDYFATAILLLRQAERGALAHLVTGQAGKIVDRNALLKAFAQDFGPQSTRALTLDCARIGAASALMEIRIRVKRDSIARGLNADGLAIPEKAPRGDCAAKILIPKSGP